MVEFPDGEQHDINFNTLAEHLYAQVDEKGNLTQLFEGIVGHHKNSRAIEKADQCYMVNGRKVKKKTTSGWDIEIEWMDNTTSWLPLKEVEATNSVELAEYAIKNQIDTEPPFDWWVKETLKRRKRLTKLSQRRHVKSSYKFAIKIPEQ